MINMKEIENKQIDSVELVPIFTAWELLEKKFKCKHLSDEDLDFRLSKRFLEDFE